MKDTTVLILEITAITWFSIGSYLTLAALVNKTWEPLAISVPLVLASFATIHFLVKDDMEKNPEDYKDL